jgi:hypothetical protein
MTPETTHYFNVFLGIGGIALQIISVVTLLLLIFVKENKYLAFVKRNFISLGLLLSIAPALVLVYSEIVGYVPCYHCWVQRIFMFPQLFLFAVAWLKKDRSVWWYSFPLIIAGTLDAIYLNYIYYFNISAGPCDASGISCTLHYVSEFNGYISIPMLALTSFISFIVLLLVAKLYKKD